MLRKCQTILLYKTVLHLQYNWGIACGAECSHDPLLYIIKKKEENFVHADWLFSAHMSSYFHAKSTRRMDRSVKDAYCSMAPVLPLIFAKVLACSAPFFFTFGLNLKHCSLSQNVIHKVIKTEFVNVITILSVKMLSFQKIY